MHARTHSPADGGQCWALPYTTSLLVGLVCIGLPPTTTLLPPTAAVAAAMAAAMAAAAAAAAAVIVAAAAAAVAATAAEAVAARPCSLPILPRSPAPYSHSALAAPASLPFRAPTPPHSALAAHDRARTQSLQQHTARPTHVVLRLGIGSLVEEQPRYVDVVVVARHGKCSVPIL